MGLLKVTKHNSDTFQSAFYRNDIWLETLKLVILDLAQDVLDLIPPDIGPAMRLKETGDGKKLDLESYWKDANEEINRQLREANAQKEARKQEPEVPLIERDGDEEVVEFGGDFGSDEPPELLVENVNETDESAESSEAAS
jgi:hypothetical protein